MLWRNSLVVPIFWKIKNLLISLFQSFNVLVSLQYPAGPPSKSQITFSPGKFEEGKADSRALNIHQAHNN